EGKKCLMLGLVDLYAFAKFLEDDWIAVMRGIPVEYGSQTKNQKDISRSMGWAKPTKRKFVNDGRPPDTTAALLDNPAKKTKTGRPNNSCNVKRDIYSTYQSYTASSETHLQNRCWMAAALESLFALYNPLRLRNASVKGATLFDHLIKHFNTRATYHLTKKGRFRTILTTGPTKLMTFANKKLGAQFVPGAFASCDYFLELLLEPKKNSPKPLKGLFEVEETRNYTCELNPANPIDPKIRSQKQDVTVLKISKQMFQWNSIELGDVFALVQSWTSVGIQKRSGLSCKCPVIDAEQQSDISKSTSPNAKKSKKSKCRKDTDPDIAVLDPLTGGFHHCMDEVSVMTFKDDTPPQHLYFYLKLPAIRRDDKANQEFMASVNWPFKLDFKGTTYTLFSRGFWNGYHYWVKVFRSSLGGISGIWIHNDRQNDGKAQLINPNPSSIGGVQPYTSWTMYSRAWTADEADYATLCIKQITEDYKDSSDGLIPFVYLRRLLKSGSNGNINESDVIQLDDDGEDDIEAIADAPEYSSEDSDEDTKSNSNSETGKSDSSDSDRAFQSEPDFDEDTKASKSGSDSETGKSDNSDSNRAFQSEPESATQSLPSLPALPTPPATKPLRLKLTLKKPAPNTSANQTEVATEVKPSPNTCITQATAVSIKPKPKPIKTGRKKLPETRADQINVATEPRPSPKTFDNQTSMATKPNPNLIKTGRKKMPENTTTNKTEVPTKPTPKPIKTGWKELPSQPIPAADFPKRQTSGRRSQN
ncbi:hypothetical protein PTTG_29835, partial [Puccinia triticina 1-1 BBBD Race 1]